MRGDYVYKIFALADLTGALLASGYPGAYPVSHSLAFTSPVPADWDHRECGV